MSDKEYYVTSTTRQPLQVLSLVPLDLLRSSPLPHPLTLRLSFLLLFELSRRSPSTRRGRNDRPGRRQRAVGCSSTMRSGGSRILWFSEAPAVSRDPSPILPCLTVLCASAHPLRPQKAPLFPTAPQLHPFWLPLCANSLYLQSVIKRKHIYKNVMISTCMKITDAC